MIGHLPKRVPDRVLKGLILGCLLTSIEEENRPLTSLEIHNFISRNSMEFISPELDSRGNPVFYGDYSYNNLPGVRSALSYLKKAGYVSLYDRDKYGEIIRTKQTQPYIWYLTPEGETHARDTFHKYRIRLDANDKIIAHLLSNDENVEALAERKRLEKCRDCRLTHPKARRLPARTWTVRPHQGKIGIQGKDDTIREYEITEDGEIKELEDLKASLVMKDGKVDAESTILSLQNEKEYLTGVLREAGVRYEKLGTAYMKEKGRKGKSDAKRLHRGLSRMEVAHWYLENNRYLDAEFFEIWGGSLVVVEYKRTVGMEILNVYYDIQSTKSEIMRRTDLSRRILEPHEIPDVGIYVAEIKGGSIVVDSEHFKEPKPLKV
jgi:hypothetical protein